MTTRLLSVTVRSPSLMPITTLPLTELRPLTSQISLMFVLIRPNHKVVFWLLIKGSRTRGRQILILPSLGKEAGALSSRANCLSYTQDRVRP